MVAAINKNLCSIVQYTADGVPDPEVGPDFDGRPPPNPADRSLRVRKVDSAERRPFLPFGQNGPLPSLQPDDREHNEFRKIAPPSCVHPGGLNLELVSEALRLNRELAERKKQREIMIVADDVSYDKQLLKSPVMRDIAMNGRPAKCGLAMTLQYCMDLGPDLRTQFSYIICCADNIHANRKRIWNYFAGVVPTYREFDAIMQSCTQDHSCLVIDNSNPSASVQNSIFHWKARLHPPPYKLCKPVYWKLDSKRPPSKQASDVLVVDERSQPPKMDRRTMQVVS